MPAILNDLQGGPLPLNTCPALLGASRGRIQEWHVSKTRLCLSAQAAGPAHPGTLPGGCEDRSLPSHCCLCLFVSSLLSCPFSKNIFVFFFFLNTPPPSFLLKCSGTAVFWRNQCSQSPGPTLMVPGNASWRLWLPLGTNVCVGVSPGKAHCIGRRRAFQAQKRGRGGWLSLDMAEVWTWWLGVGVGEWQVE